MGIPYLAVIVPIKVIDAGFRAFPLGDILHKRVIVHDLGMLLRRYSGGRLRYPGAALISPWIADLPIVANHVLLVPDPIRLRNGDVTHLDDDAGPRGAHPAHGSASRPSPTVARGSAPSPVPGADKNESDGNDCKSGEQCSIHRFILVVAIY
jgi:hypothetical protein